VTGQERRRRFAGGTAGRWHIAGGSRGDVVVADRSAGWLRIRRTRAMLTQEELAELSGVDARTIRDIETGRTKYPRANTLRLLKDALAASEPEDTDEPATGRAHHVPRALRPASSGF